MFFFGIESQRHPACIERLPGLMMLSHQSSRNLKLSFLNHTHPLGWCATGRQTPTEQPDSNGMFYSYTDESSASSHPWWHHKVSYRSALHFTCAVRQHAHTKRARNLHRNKAKRLSISGGRVANRPVIEFAANLLIHTIIGQFLRWFEGGGEG